MNLWNILSELLGWTYFTAWSFSLYPQLLLNWKRKSVSGLSLDYLCFSAVGFICYAVFTIAFYFNQEIQDEYYKRHYSKNLVRLNDVAFAIHGLMVSFLLIYQTYIYKGTRRRRRISSFAATVTWMASLGGLLIILSVVYGNSEWILFIYYLSYLKLGSDVLKYLPQILYNFKRKSTIGWSTHLVFMDAIGAICSLCQLLLDAYIEGGDIMGDSVKFGIAVIAIIYDFIFMFQHYVLYYQYYIEEVIVIKNGNSKKIYGAV
ncbi:PQ loop repeat-domain-containing protein [Cunninghamella echinulata]|nr:PQ loop repeat-domain-containing protein [Cunninghamella echinulata]